MNYYSSEVNKNQDQCKETLQNAQNLLKNGISIIPLKPFGDKTPSLYEWKQYQNRLPHPGEVEQWWQEVYQDIAIIGGEISGNLVIIDVDEKNEAGLFSKIRPKCEHLLATLPIYRTPSGGYHIYCRTTEPIPTDKLARTEDKITLVETKGEGGYVLAPGKQSYGLYSHVSGPSVLEVPVITPDEWATLETACRALNRCEDKEHGDYDDRDHEEVIKIEKTPTKYRIQQAEAWLENQPGTVQGENADGRCFAIAMSLVWGFALPVDHAEDLLIDWGRRDDQTNQYGSHYPWSSGEMRHKIKDAIRHQYQGRAGDKLHDGWMIDATADLFGEMDMPDFDESEPEYFDSSDFIGVLEGKQKPALPKVDDIPKVLPKIEPSEQAIKPPKQKRIFSIAECLNQPKPNWLVKGHIRKNTLTVVFGDSQTLKSFWMMSMGVSIVSGKKFLGKYDPKTRGKVVYLAREGAVFNIGLRLKAACDKMGVSLDEIQRDLLIFNESYFLNKKEDFAQFVQDMDEQGTEPVLIVVDTLSKTLEGSDKSNEDINPYLQNLNKLLPRTTVVVIAHTGHVEKGRPRGASELTNDIDNQIVLRKTDTTNATGRAEDEKQWSKKFIEVFCTKTKDDEAEWSYYFSATKTDPMAWDDDNEPITTLTLDWVDANEIKVKPVAKLPAEQVEDNYYLSNLVEGEEMKLGDIKDRLGWHHEAEERVRARLVENGKISQREVSRGAVKSIFIKMNSNHQADGNEAGGGTDIR
jgi:hypothetical protein